MRTKTIDFIVIGGGLVGSAIAYGLARKNRHIVILDEGDCAFRASRGNFGLVWVQGKGWNNAPYSRWSFEGAELWPEFHATLRNATGVEMGFSQPGGIEFCLSESEWEQRGREMAGCAANTHGAFTYQMLERTRLLKRFPTLGEDVVGAALSPHDGHVNPLYLLRALHQQLQTLGARYQPNQHVATIENRGAEFVVHTNDSSYAAGKLLLCAGLDNTRLAAQVGIQAPIEAVRGQILITERVKPFLPMPTLQVRQTQEGSLQIGDSHEHVGENDGTRADVVAAIARRAVKIFPFLEHVQLVRAWGALRIMTPDGAPVYAESHECPGAFAVSTHSGVSLAAAHAGPVADWIAGDQAHPLLQHFGAERFDVSAA